MIVLSYNDDAALNVSARRRLQQHVCVAVRYQMLEVVKGGQRHERRAITGVSIAQDDRNRIALEATQLRRQQKAVWCAGGLKYDGKDEMKSR